MRKTKIYICMAMLCVLMIVNVISVGATSAEVVKQYTFNVGNNTDSMVVYEYYITDGRSEIYYQGNDLHSVEILKSLSAMGETITIRAKVTLPLTQEQAIYLSTCDKVNVNVTGTAQNNWVGVAGYFSDVGYWDSAAAYSYVMLGYDGNEYNGLVSNTHREYKTTASTVYIEPYSFEYTMPKETYEFTTLNVEYVFTLNNIKANGVQFNLYFGNLDVDIVCQYMSSTSIGRVDNQISNMIVQEQTQVIKDQTDKLINQGNTIIQPDQGDIVDINNMQSNVSNRQEQSEQLVEDIRVDKPTITDELLNPVDDVDDESLNTMGGVLGAVFVSPTLGSIAVMALVFGLIGYILYGKR